MKPREHVVKVAATLSNLVAKGMLTSDARSQRYRSLWFLGQEQSALL